MGVNLGRNKFASNFDYVKGVNVLVSKGQHPLLLA